MKKIFIFLMLIVSSAFSQYSAELIAFDGVAENYSRLTSFNYVKPFDRSFLALDNAIIAIVIRDRFRAGVLKPDTLWFHRASQRGRAHFIEISNGTLPSRFAIGDSVSAMIVGGDRPYWTNGKILDVSTSGRYLVKFRDVIDYDPESKKFAYKDRREWISESDVESYAYSTKYRSR